jgi:hypothetical protein
LPIAVHPLVAAINPERSSKAVSRLEMAEDFREFIGQGPR